MRVQFFTNFWFSGYKFRSRYARKYINDSKDSDDNLVSTKTFSQKIVSLVWRPGSGEVGQNDEKTPPLVKTPTGNHKPKTKIFLPILTRRFAESLDGLNSSLAESVGELWRCKLGQKCLVHVQINSKRLTKCNFFNNQNAAIIFCKLSPIPVLILNFGNNLQSESNPNPIKIL